ncbi:hypothetical protein [Reyranella sp. CPCC 100927]|uniref:hypothetical protein n=1 Tax=Reyranella sp. CPCC 100927 TaxID=2599616 RepID=UPI0011B6DCF4|nr:hypothetical protein [Reyranella sp. CPCC 100927]TWT09546.1 hypothetical protein FQU96_20435 [Reyranella sp. CPCC 100927]
MADFLNLRPQYPGMLVDLTDFNATRGVDPEGSDYDYESAKKAGFAPDETGHWPSRAPLDREESKRLGLPKITG